MEFHDLDRIMGHYNEQIEFVSPFVVKLLNDRTGTICRTLQGR
jgi:hypothetical protein